MPGRSPVRKARFVLFGRPTAARSGLSRTASSVALDVETGATRVLVEAPYSGLLAGAWGDDVIVFIGATGLFRISPAGGEPLAVINSSDNLEPLTPSFLPNGRRFLYLAQREGGRRHQVCVASLDSDETSCLEGIDTPVVYAAPGDLLFVRDGSSLRSRSTPNGSKRPARRSGSGMRRSQ